MGSSEKGAGIWHYKNTNPVEYGFHFYDLTYCEELEKSKPIPDENHKKTLKEMLGYG